MAARDYALVVGIDGYSTFDGLRGAESDARAFESWLLHPDGGNVSPENVTAILSVVANALTDALETFGVEG